LPITYSIEDCDEIKIKKMDYAVQEFNKYFNVEFLTKKEIGESNINFICKDNDKGEIVDYNTDFWRVLVIQH